MADTVTADDFTAVALVSLQDKFMVNLPRASALRAGKILVVGAGLAGLVATYRLRQAGVAVDLIEARDRPGGRVLSVTHALGTGIAAEMGGEAFDSDYA
ncbi:MAG: NAD(P)-binding protein [Cyanobacteria bacterium]|nr:NAD(P)-binding protein [Cyanobacteriota bacterium]